MSLEVLHPYTDFETNELAAQLHQAVQFNAPLLAARNIQGLIKRYGEDLETAQENVEKGKRDHAQGIGHYAIMSDSGDVVGSASLYPDLPLHKLRVPLPIGIARHIPGLTVKYPAANPNIHAWTTLQDDLLPKAYRDLLNLSGGVAGFEPLSGMPMAKEPFTTTWTFEPHSSPKDIHVAIMESGLKMAAIGRFDDGEVAKSVPPEGVVYANLHSLWRTPHGRLKELRTGRLNKYDRAVQDRFFNR